MARELFRTSKTGAGTNAGVTVTIDYDNPAFPDVAGAARNTSEQVAGTTGPGGAGTPINSPATGYNAAVVTHIQLMPTKVSVTSDTGALVTIESPANTVLWQKRYAGAFDDEINFGSDIENGSLIAGAEIGAVDTDLLVKISASTSHCEANIEAAALLAG